MASSTQFYEKPWAEREPLLGDDAESVFTEVMGADNCYKYGLDRPPIQLGHLPEFVRFTPDFLQEHRAVEVLGVGKDQIVKIKVNKLLALLKWNLYMPVFVFIYSSYRNAWCLIPIESFSVTLHERGQTKRFPEGPLAWFCTVGDLGVLWHAR